MSVIRQKKFYFSLLISQEQFLRYYQGTAGAIQVFSECGQRLRFPASRLRPFLTHTGIKGRFQLTTSAENRFINLKKLS